MHKAQDQSALSRQENTLLRSKVVEAVRIGRELHQQVQLGREQGNPGAQFGLQPQEVTQALRVAAEMKTNPQQGLKNLLTQLSINGIDISSLGLDSTIDPKALGGMIRQELDGATRPLREAQERQDQARQQAAQQQQHYNRVEQNTRQFFQQNPDAVPYLQAIQRMYNDPRFTNSTLQENWLRLQLHLARDPGASATPFPRQQRSLPNGRSASAPQQQQANTTRVAPVDQDYKSIIDDILTEYKVA